MLNAIIVLIIDAVILMLLMNFMVGERRDFIKSLIAALVGAVCAAALTMLMTPVGPHANLIATLVVAVGMGIAVWLLFAVRFGTALTIGIVFAVVRIVLYQVLLSLHSPPPI